MNATKIVMEVLATGGAWSQAELQFKTGLPENRVRNALLLLGQRGHRAIEPVRYTAAEAGRDWLAAMALKEEMKALAKAAAMVPKKTGRPPLPPEVRTARERERVLRQTQQRALKRLQDQIARRAAAEQAAERERIARLAEESVQSARATRTPIEMAWGALHA